MTGIQDKIIKLKLGLLDLAKQLGSVNQTMMQSARGRRDSLSGRLFRNWKAFLQAEAINDPLAMAIMIAQRKLIEGVTLGR